MARPLALTVPTHTKISLAKGHHHDLAEPVNDSDEHAVLEAHNRLVTIPKAVRGTHKVHERAVQVTLFDMRRLARHCTT